MSYTWFGLLGLTLSRAASSGPTLGIMDVSGAAICMVLAALATGSVMYCVTADTGTNSMQPALTRTLLGNAAASSVLSLAIAIPALLASSARVPAV